MDELDRLLDNNAAPTAVGVLPLDVGSVAWLQLWAELDGVSFEQAIAWAVGEYRSFCLEGKMVERSLRLADEMGL